MDDGLHILIVEDNKFDALHLRELLTPFASRFDVADTLVGAIDLLSVACPDLIFLDLRLPDAAGPELITGIRRINSTTPIVVVTGVEPPEYEELALVQDVVQKPFEDRMALLLALGYGVKFHMASMPERVRHG